jgi:hypothetical protein
VLDKTGFKENYDFELRWTANSGAGGLLTAAQPSVGFGRQKTAKCLGTTHIVNVDREVIR